MHDIIETAGAKIALTEQGSGKTALVFLHYWGGSGRTWRHVAARLGDAHLLMPDLRGWGASVANDERYDLDAMADDVGAVIAAKGLTRFALVGHSMGGKVAQMLAMRGLPGLAGLVLVAPAPTAPMPVPAEIRAAMLASYQSAEGVAQAIGVLTHGPLSDEDRAMVTEDTLGGADGAKRAWPETGMVADLGQGLSAFDGPVTILVGAADKVENPDRLRALYAAQLPQAKFRVNAGAGHLSPLEAPDSVADACRDMLGRLSG
ncbi:alpha/beta hydrolase [Acidisoma cellulosilytica]|uniref:Alpha/beta hydrolase n=1 Tax=Acidisoma cellulosilyticum TaxID=2802395 RepID=A0A963YYL1_9PROT|nr:alpha/beta hydrolase [Acidisoma cellulosilyticum]MCB8879546.1 alpha/beta hydrolase [Acidisoma cellulosilyticum]